MNRERKVQPAIRVTAVTESPATNLSRTYPQPLTKRVMTVKRAIVTDNRVNLPNSAKTFHTTLPSKNSGSSRRRPQELERKVAKHAETSQTLLELRSNLGYSLLSKSSGVPIKEPSALNKLKERALSKESSASSITSSSRSPAKLITARRQALNRKLQSKEPVESATTPPPTKRDERKQQEVFEYMKAKRLRKIKEEHERKLKIDSEARAKKERLHRLDMIRKEQGVNIQLAKRKKERSETEMAPVETPKKDVSFHITQKVLPNDNTEVETNVEPATIIVDDANLNTQESVDLLEYIDCYAHALEPTEAEHSSTPEIRLSPPCPQKPKLDTSFLYPMLHNLTEMGKRLSDVVKRQTTANPPVPAKSERQEQLEFLKEFQKEFTKSCNLSYAKSRAHAKSRRPIISDGWDAIDSKPFVANRIKIPSSVEAPENLPETFIHQIPPPKLQSRRSIVSDGCGAIDSKPFVANRIKIPSPVKAPENVPETFIHQIPPPKLQSRRSILSDGCGSIDSKASLASRIKIPSNAEAPEAETIIHQIPPPKLQSLEETSKFESIPVGGDSAFIAKPDIKHSKGDSLIQNAWSTDGRAKLIPYRESPSLAFESYEEAPNIRKVVKSPKYKPFEHEPDDMHSVVNTYSRLFLSNTSEAKPKSDVVQKQDQDVQTSNLSSEYSEQFDADQSILDKAEGFVSEGDNNDISDSIVIKDIPPVQNKENKLKNDQISVVSELYSNITGTQLRGTTEVQPQSSHSQHSRCSSLSSSCCSSSSTSSDSSCSCDTRSHERTSKNILSYYENTTKAMLLKDKLSPNDLANCFDDHLNQMFCTENYINQLLQVDHWKKAGTSQHETMTLRQIILDQKRRSEQSGFRDFESKDHIKKATSSHGNDKCENESNSFKNPTTILDPIEDAVRIPIDISTSKVEVEQAHEDTSLNNRVRELEDQVRRSINQMSSRIQKCPSNTKISIQEMVTPVIKDHITEEMIGSRSDNIATDISVSDFPSQNSSITENSVIKESINGNSDIEESIMEDSHLSDKSISNETEEDRKSLSSSSSYSTSSSLSSLDKKIQTLKKLTQKNKRTEHLNAKLKRISDAVKLAHSVAQKSEKRIQIQKKIEEGKKSLARIVNASLENEKKSKKIGKVDAPSISPTEQYESEFSEISKAAESISELAGDEASIETDIEVAIESAGEESSLKSLISSFYEDSELVKSQIEESLNEDSINASSKLSIDSDEENSPLNVLEIDKKGSVRSLKPSSPKSQHQLSKTINISNAPKDLTSVSSIVEDFVEDEEPIQIDDQSSSPSYPKNSTSLMRENTVSVLEKDKKEHFDMSKEIDEDSIEIDFEVDKQSPSSIHTDLGNYLPLKIDDTSTVSSLEKDQEKVSELLAADNRAVESATEKELAEIGFQVKIDSPASPIAPVSENSLYLKRDGESSLSSIHEGQNEVPEILDAASSVSEHIFNNDSIETDIEADKPPTDIENCLSLKRDAVTSEIFDAQEDQKAVSEISEASSVLESKSDGDSIEVDIEVDKQSPPDVPTDPEISMSVKGDDTFSEKDVSDILGAQPTSKTDIDTGSSPFGLSSKTIPKEASFADASHGISSEENYGKASNNIEIVEETRSIFNDQIEEDCIIPLKEIDIDEDNNGAGKSDYSAHSKNPSLVPVCDSSIEKDTNKFPAVLEVEKSSQLPVVQGQEHIDVNKSEFSTHSQNSLLLSTSVSFAEERSLEKDINTLSDAEELEDKEESIAVGQINKVNPDVSVSAYSHNVNFLAEDRLLPASVEREEIETSVAEPCEKSISVASQESVSSAHSDILQKNINDIDAVSFEKDLDVYSSISKGVESLSSATEKPTISEPRMINYTQETVEMDIPLPSSKEPHSPEWDIAKVTKSMAVNQESIELITDTLFKEILGSCFQENYEFEKATDESLGFSNTRTEVNGDIQNSNIIPFLSTVHPSPTEIKYKELEIITPDLVESALPVERASREHIITHSFEQVEDNSNIAPTKRIIPLPLEGKVERESSVAGSVITSSVNQGSTRETLEKLVAKYMDDGVSSEAVAEKVVDKLFEVDDKDEEEEEDSDEEDDEDVEEPSAHSTVSSLKRYDLTDSDDEDLTKRVVGPNPEWSKLSPLEKLRLQLGDEVAKEFCDEDFIFEKQNERELLTMGKFPTPPPNDGQTWRNSTTAVELAKYFLELLPSQSAFDTPIQLPEEILNEANKNKPEHLINWQTLIFYNINDEITGCFHAHNKFNDPINQLRRKPALRPPPVSRHSIIEKVLDKIWESASYREVHYDNMDMMLIQDVKQAEKAWRDLGDTEVQVKNDLADSIMQSILVDELLLI